MDYEKKYKEALELARDYYKANLKLHKADENAILEDIFPELAESEDERIRKAIIESLPKYGYLPQTSIKVKDAIAWLEKQGEPFDKEKVLIGARKDVALSIINYLDNNSVGMCLSNMECEDIEDACINSKWTKLYNYMKKKLEKQGDKPFDYENANIQQKDFAPKQEPKFKVGDFIVNDYCMGKVIALTDDAYLLDSGQGIPFSCEHNAHLWSIQDAKDGDVLNSPTHHLIWIYKDNEHYHACVNMNYVTENVATDGLISIPNDACPATKDEQTILFARMKETGYEWDAKKLELKKVEQNPAWSRDDEKVYLSIMSVLLSTIGTDKNGFTVTREMDWLKSIKERYTWKPSDEQMKCLSDVVHKAKYKNDISVGGYSAYMPLASLYLDLKKLREE